MAEVGLDAAELDKWEKRVLAIIQNEAPKEYRKIVRQAGNLLRKKVRRITPRITGELRRSYRVKTKRSKNKEYEVEVGTNLFYAKMVEEGHVVKRSRKGPELGFAPGKFYFRKACEETEKELPALLKNSIRRIAKEMGLDVWG